MSADSQPTLGCPEFLVDFPAAVVVRTVADLEFRNRSIAQQFPFQANAGAPAHAQVVFKLARVTLGVLVNLPVAVVVYAVTLLGSRDHRRTAGLPIDADRRPGALTPLVLDGARLPFRFFINLQIAVVILAVAHLRRPGVHLRVPGVAIGDIGVSVVVFVARIHTVGYAVLVQVGVAFVHLPVTVVVLAVTNLLRIVVDFRVLRLAVGAVRISVAVVIEVAGVALTVLV